MLNFFMLLRSRPRARRSIPPVAVKSMIKSAGMLDPMLKNKNESEP
jgi:hypothetical protein